MPSDFIVADGFDIELIAAEPLISDPVDMEIDELGRLFVVEMHGYPLDKSGSGKIKQLIDTDNDGRFDKSIVFADGFVLPNSIMRWKNGFIVTDAPNVLYLEDIDNDGRADKIDTLLTGFALSNPQHNLSSPLLGIDNWIYLAHEGAVGTETYKKEFGDRGSEVYFPGHDTPRLAINAGSRSVRFQPDQHLLEMTSSHSQFGHSFDAWGHHLQVGNANHIYQEVISEQYLKRNPDLLLSDATESLSDHGDAAEVFPITQNPQHQLLTDLGVITSACGIHAYLGGAFPAPYDHAVFVAEPVSNLVHVDELKDNKTVYTASRIKEHQEFLASKDPKFRPVNIYNGPDGALYIVDFYRQIIEHPEWMGDDVVKSGALYNDSDKGRIYRIIPKGGSSPEWIKGLNLSKAPTDTLVNLLGNKNYWWRLNAQRLLIDRQDGNTTALVSTLVANQEQPYGRLHGLWILNALGTLTNGQIIAALSDPVDGIRENAIRIAEQHLNDNAELLAALLKLENDKSIKVRYQLLCTLGGIAKAETQAAVEKILLHDIDDNWIQVAALTSNREMMPRLLTLAIEQSNATGLPYASLISKLTAMIAKNNNTAAIHQMLQQIFLNQSAPWITGALEGLTNGAGENKVLQLSLPDQQQLIAFCFNPSTRSPGSVVNLLNHVELDSKLIIAQISQAVTVAKNQRATDDERAAAIDLMSLKNPKGHTSLLRSFVNPIEPITVQLAAIRTMDQIPDTALTKFLITKWPVLTPELRDAGVRSMLADDSRIALLLDALDNGKISSSEIAWPRKVGLMAQRNLALRDKARSIFTTNTDAETIQSYTKTLSMAGDASKGKMLFVTQCSLCHQIRGKGGIALGPDLGTVHNWSKEAIMTNILFPNKSISSGFELWSIEMKSGESIQGIIDSETSGAITLKNVNGWQKTISRRDIKTLSALSLSVMPEDLNNKIDVNQMADLLEYLKNNYKL
ncbi:MAG: PVC-type heme-binding CxxCH protein [Chryseolinea sp.]